MGGRGSCRARNGKRVAKANSFFWRAALLRCRKIFCASGDAPSSFSDCFSRLRFCRHRFQSVDEMGGRGSCRARNDSEWRRRIVFSGGQRSCAAEKFSAHQEMRPPVFQTALAGFVFVRHRLQSVDEMGGRGSCRARNGKRVAKANSFFWRAALLRCRKIFCASGDAPSSFSDCFSRLRFCRH
jgi:hypothetical protein